MFGQKEQSGHSEGDQIDGGYIPSVRSDEYFVTAQGCNGNAMEKVDFVRNDANKSNKRIPDSLKWQYGDNQGADQGHNNIAQNPDVGISCEVEGGEKKKKPCQ